jgi:hypothetical protein
MSDGLLDHTQIEQLAIDSFAHVRRDAQALGAHNGFGVDLTIVPGNAETATSGVALTVRLVIYEGESIRDVKEQSVFVVPAGCDDTKLGAYFEGIALGARRPRRARKRTR